MSQFDLPKFSDVKPDQIETQLKQFIANCKLTVEEKLKQSHFTWDNLIAPVDAAEDELSKFWSPISHMNSVVSSEELREAHDACLPLLSEYGTWLGQNKALFEAHVAIKEDASFNDLTTAQKKVVNDAIRDFKLSGVALEDEKKQRYGEIKSKLSELSSKFSNQVMDATLGWNKHITDESELAGLPDSAKAAAAQAARQQDLQGWLFTLDIPSYLPVMTYCDNRALREEMYTAFTTRASDVGPNAGKWDNAPLIDEILALRAELSELLGFNNYAALSLATKMAESTEQVNSFLHDLAVRSKPQAQKERQEVIDFAQAEFGVSDLAVWDMPYYSEKLKHAQYNISDEMLRPYFPEEKVVNGMFEVVSRLYGLKIEKVPDVDVWHKDVSFYKITDDNDELRGGFYLDLYARPKKRGGAWMDECRTRHIKMDGSLQFPIAYLNCNFSGPVDGKPALFTHDEVITLFHEFGHGLHHMLTKVDVMAVSGINGVPWDAVELPSQFLENWCWEKDTLSFLSGHYETGEPLPDDLLEKMLRARNFQSAMQMVRQLEFSIFDFRLHQHYDASTNVQAVLDEVRKEVAVNIPPASNRFQNAFTHIFGGGYSAGYYSYKWAEVLSSDAYSRFEEEGIFNREVGDAFLHHILEQGGSEEPMDLFKAFRGREPSIDPLLRHSGIQ
ncbi:oligopeptidase A [Alteromonas sp. a30]|uniref:oligopeptidase A n=1 Tax=Alteromonas sp. a30 TaxID=2730917 RepID=UPI00227F67C5|nr:oligopeptidase A [Alteromonas sp. a30]MCY7295348.1 oligopeptidase A [Alteromonas sp. a30]